MELFGIGHHIIFAQFLPDIVHLFPKHVLLLVFLHPRLHLFGEFGTDLGHFNFFIKDFCQYLITGIQINRFQYLLFFIKSNRHAFDELIHKHAQAEGTLKMLQHGFSDSRKERTELQKKLPQVADHGFFLYIRTLHGPAMPSLIQVKG